jgi:tetratricopeptide (TPR) repeat protein
MLAGLYADVGRLNEAAEEVDSLAVDRFRIIPRDWAFPLAIRYLAETCAQLADRKRALQLLPEIQLYRSQLLVVTQGSSIEAAADRSLGQLYAVLGRFDEADLHYRDAERLEKSMGFVPLAVRTRYWRARLLADSNDPDARQQAMTLLDDAHSVACSLGMKLLAKQANEFRGLLRDNSKHPHRFDINRRSGDHPGLG